MTTFKVGDYVDAFDGFVLGCVVEVSPYRMWVDHYSLMDRVWGSLFVSADQFGSIALIMPAAAASYFEQFVGDEGGDA